MSLSISNSEQYKRKIFILLLFTLSMYVLINEGFERWDAYVIKRNENIGIYGHGVQAKFHLIKSIFGNNKPDIIFIGNSITNLHIDTYFFHRNKINSFNYAFAGYFIAQYPAMIKNAISLKPKVIAISILLQDFYKSSVYYVDHYQPDMNVADISYENLKFLAKHVRAQDRYMFLKYIGYYLKNYNYFIREGFTIRNNIARLVKTHQAFRFIAGLFPAADKKSSTRLTFDCRFDDRGNRTTACFNGDFVLIGHRKKLAAYRENEYLKTENFNYYLLAVFNEFFDQIRKAGIEPVLILIPSFKQFIADKSILRKNLHANIIDLSDMKFSINNFADFTHFNIQGRKAYSLTLADQVKQLLV